MVEMSQPPQRSVPPLHHHHSRSADVLFTALSIFFLFSSTPPSSSKTFKIPFLSCPIKINTRKLLKFPTMSSPPPVPIPKSHPHHHHHRNFATPQSLSDWLKPRLPSDSFAMWGVKPGTKNVHNLWLELSEGETSLADSTPPVRNVNVVTVRIIGKDGKTLIESRQELSDGSVRDRSRPLSEKMKPGETPEDAVFRAVKEELGSIVAGSTADFREIVTIIPGSYSQKVEERNSGSYPGLPARYVLHSVDAIVEGLPAEEFSTEETDEYGDCEIGIGLADQAVSVKRHHWKWVSPDSTES